MLHACQPSVIRTETPYFWRLKSLSFEGHLENKMEYIFGNQVLIGQEGYPERVYAGGKDTEGVEDGPDSADMEEDWGCA